MKWKTEQSLEQWAVSGAVNLVGLARAGHSPATRPPAILVCRLMVDRALSWAKGALSWAKGALSWVRGALSWARPIRRFQ
jgi:hypothetical protein